MITAPNNRRPLVGSSLPPPPRSSLIAGGTARAGCARTQDIIREGIDPTLYPIPSFQFQTPPLDLAKLGSQFDLAVPRLNGAAAHHSTPLGENEVPLAHGYPCCTSSHGIASAQHDNFGATFIAPTANDFPESFHSTVPSIQAAQLLRSRSIDFQWDTNVDTFTPHDAFQNIFTEDPLAISQTSVVQQPYYIEETAPMSVFDAVHQPDSVNMHEIGMPICSPPLQVADLHSPESDFSSTMTLFAESNNDPASIDVDWASPFPPSASIDLTGPRSDTISEGSNAAPVHNKASKKRTSKPRSSGIDKTRAYQASRRKKVTKRNRGLNHDERENAQAMREVGPCVRCRLYKVKVGIFQCNPPHILAYTSTISVT